VSAKNISLKTCIISANSTNEELAFVLNSLIFAAWAIAWP